MNTDKNWIAENLGKDLPMILLAERAAMSVRNFERVFAREVGVSPARYVTQMRVEAAQRMLEKSDRSLDEIASACGFFQRGINAPSIRPLAGQDPACSPDSDPRP